MIRVSPVTILNTAFYKFVSLENLPELRRLLKARCLELKLKGTLLLSPEGINGFLAGAPDAITEFKQVLAGMDPFKDLSFKESFSDDVPFGRMLVKLKKEIIPMGRPDIQPQTETGTRLKAETLKKWLDEKKELVLLDTRNEYEVREGTFENALNLGISTFRQIPEKMESLSEAVKAKPVVMFCTGGIRCEKATALALKMGFSEVYQLEGGILKYFEECGNHHYKGNCFVFDERVALDSLSCVLSTY